MVTSVRSSPFRKAPSVERFAAAAERCPIEDGCPPKKGCGSMGFANKGDKRNNKVDLMYIYIYNYYILQICIYIYIIIYNYIYIYIKHYTIYIYTSLHILQIRNAFFLVLQCFLLGETWRN